MLQRINYSYTHTNARLLRFQVSAFLLESTALLEAAANEKTTSVSKQRKYFTLSCTHHLVRDNWFFFWNISFCHVHSITITYQNH